MFPIRDDAPRSTTPFVNYFLIGLNIAIFLFEWSLDKHSRLVFEMNFALIPHNLVGWAAGVVPASYAFPPILTSMFLHANWKHVLFNMWFLYIFGDNVEDRFGHFGYLLFYLASGLGAALTHLVFNLNSQVPTVGASGAIAGVMGAYFLLYPRARVLIWFFFIFFFWVPAWLVIGFWFVVQLLDGAASAIGPASGNVGGVAVWAHVGGFITGLLLSKIMPKQSRYYSFEDY
jgi:membrane associated rhomboid family serine protease